LDERLKELTDEQPLDDTQRREINLQLLRAFEIVYFCKFLARPEDLQNTHLGARIHTVANFIHLLGTSERT
jgi:hypothetical protein